jgi:hypothetical protein
MNVRVIYSDEYSVEDIIKIKKLLEDNFDNNDNYAVENWESKPSSFLHIFLKSSRFDKGHGGVVLVEDGAKLCGISGFNRSDFHPDIYVLGVRTLIDFSYRKNLFMSTYFVPTQLELLEHSAKIVVFLFDTRDKFNLYSVFCSGKLNLFLFNKLKKFDHIWSNLKALEHPVYINYTNQNVLYIQLDKEFDFDWKTLKEHNDI